MDTPVSLLRSAVFENDGVIRTAKVVKACKILTDTLPFEHKNHMLIEEQELLKHLMLCLPINPTAINLIIKSMFEKFKRIHHFLKEMWLGFDFIAQIPEKEPEKTGAKLLQFGIRRLLKMTQPPTEPTSPKDSGKYDFCEEVNKYKMQIKLKVIEYVEIVLESYFKELRDSVAFRPDISALIKKFIQFTQSEKIIIKCCQMIEKIKILDNSLRYDYDIDELLLSKKNLISEITPKPPKKESRTSSKQNTIIQPDTSKTPNFVQGSPNATPGGAVPIPQKKDIIANTFMKALLKSGTNSINESPKKLDLTEQDEKVFIMGSQIEEWLTEFPLNEVPMIQKSDNIKDMIRNQENFELLLSYIFEPFNNPVCSQWEKKFPFLAGCPALDGFASASPGKQSIGTNYFRDDRRYHPFMVRSFKAMQMLCDIKNFKYITQVNRQAVEAFFHILYTTLGKPEILGNINHIARVLEYLLKKEADVCLNFVIHYNLMFRLLQFIDFEYVQHFFITIFNCEETPLDLQGDAQKKIFKYCELTNFFTDLANALLVGEKSLPSNKFDANFKPPGVDELIRLEGEIEFGVAREEKVTGQTAENFLLEEVQGFRSDIDGIQVVIKGKKKFDPKALLDRSRSVGSANKLTTKNYPSLMEKRRREEEEVRAQSLDINGQVSRKNTIGELKIGHGKSDDSQKDGGKKGVTFSKNKGNLQLSVENDLKSSPKGLKHQGSTVKSRTTINISEGLKGDLQTPNSNSEGYFKQNSSLTKLDKPRQLPPLEKKPTMRSSTNEKDSLNMSNPSFGIINGPSPIVPSGFVSPKLDLQKDLKPVELDQSMKSSNKLSDSKITEPRPGRKLLNALSETPRDTPNSQGVGNAKQLEKITEKVELITPTRKTIAQEIDLAVTGKKELESLNNLYQVLIKNYEEKEIDREAKKQEYNANFIRYNDNYSLAVCDLLQSIFRKTLSDSENPQMRAMISENEVNHSHLWNAMFSDGRGLIFDKLMQNYLIKIKVHHLMDTNSAYSAGQAVNLILDKCLSNPDLMKHYKTIINICHDHFHFLCRVLIHSHAWVVKRDQKIYMQTYEVKEPLGSGRLLLVQTLKKIIDCDRPSNYIVLHEMNDTVWHTLILWFFEKKTNNIYQTLFYSILEIAFLNVGEKLVLNVLFKLNLLGYIKKLWEGICINGIIMKDNHVDSLFYFMKAIISLIESLAQNTGVYPNLGVQLGASVGWKDLKEAIGTRSLKKKRTNIAAQLRHDDSSKHMTILPDKGDPMRIRSKTNHPGTQVLLKGSLKNVSHQTGGHRDLQVIAESQPRHETPV